jgi:hypothetical protein
VEWIAGVHGGSLSVVAGHNENSFVIQLPDVTSPAGPDISTQVADLAPDSHRGAL